jgi:hypothetical protein
MTKLAALAAGDRAEQRTAGYRKNEEVIPYLTTDDRQSTTNLQYFTLNRNVVFLKKNSNFDLYQGNPHRNEADIAPQFDNQPGRIIVNAGI